MVHFVYYQKQANIHNPPPTQHNSNISRQQRKEDMARQYTIMLMTLALSFLVCLILSVSLTFISLAFPQYAFVFYALAEICIIVNNSMNFVFYCISGEAFRKAFKKAIMKKCGISERQ